jgi:hypothetical protein
MIRTTTNMLRCLLFQASLPASYWAEALHTATHLLNRLPSKAVSHPNPHFALYGAAPSYDHLRVFGCACYPNTFATAPHKLSPRSTAAYSLATLLTTRGTGVWTSPPTASSSLVTSSLTKMCFPLLAPPNPPILTPSSSLIRFHPHHMRPALRHYLHLVRPRRLHSRPFLRHTRPRRPRLRHARSRRSCLRHARHRRPRLHHAWPHRSCLRHAWPRRPSLRHSRPRRPRLRHARSRRPRLASPTPHSSITAAATPLPQRSPTWARRRARPASPTPPSSITAASRPYPPLSTFGRFALSRPYTTRSPSTATLGTSTRW